MQRISVGAGDIVTGNPAQPIVRFAPDEAPLVRAEVNQEFAERVRVGQKAVIRDDARSGPKWRGKVEARRRLVREAPADNARSLGLHGCADGRVLDYD